MPWLDEMIDEYWNTYWDKLVEAHGNKSRKEPVADRKPVRGSVVRIIEDGTRDYLSSRLNIPITADGASVVYDAGARTKNWDIVAPGAAAPDLLVSIKSMMNVFGKNLNNRLEEADGDILSVRRYLPGSVKVGYLFAILDCPSSRGVSQRSGKNEKKKRKIILDTIQNGGDFFETPDPEWLEKNGWELSGGTGRPGTDYIKRLELLLQDLAGHRHGRLDLPHYDSIALVPFRVAGSPGAWKVSVTEVVPSLSASEFANRMKEG